VRRHGVAVQTIQLVVRLLAAAAAEHVRVHYIQTDVKKVEFLIEEGVMSVTTSMRRRLVAWTGTLGGYSFPPDLLTKRMTITGDADRKRNWMGKSCTLHSS